MVMAAAVSKPMASGRLDQRTDRHDPLGRIGPQRAAGVGHAIADGEGGDPLAHRHDLARALHADAARQRGGVVAGAEIGVGEVQADGGVADADLAGSGIADLDLTVVKDLGSTKLRKANGLGHHGSPAGGASEETPPGSNQKRVRSSMP
jgi:hypothetical protein